MKTPSSIVTPSQMNVWLEILQFLPMTAFFWISTKAPILLLSPTAHPYRLRNFESFTFFPSFTSEEIQEYSLISRLFLPCSTGIGPRLPVSAPP